MVGDDLGGAARLFDDSIFDVGIGPQLGDLFIGRVVLVSVLDCDDVEVWIGRLAGGIILVENLVAVQSGICGKVVIDDGTIDAAAVRRTESQYAASIGLKVYNPSEESQGRDIGKKSHKGSTPTWSDALKR